MDVVVTQQDSGADARTFFEAASGLPGGELLSGLGSAAAFTPEDDDGAVVLKGRTSLLVAVSSTAQANPRGALQKLAPAVLPRT